MALADSREAIGAVSVLLQNQLTARTTVSSVDVGRPETAALTAGSKFNLFLYQVEIDSHLRNQSLDRGQKSPLWLVLKYLLTAFDNDRESDSSDAHDMLGEGMLALQELSFLNPATLPLQDNPERLKITFDNADAELLSKVMQGGDEKYRISIAFQIRPIMIAPSAPPSYSLSVQTVGPGNEGVIVIPTLGPRLESVEPQKFVSNTELTIKGQDVNASISEVLIGDQSFSVSSSSEGEISTLVPATTALSAGNHPLCLRRQLPGGMNIKSDVIAVQFLPEVTSATPGALTTSGAAVFGDLTISGRQLGGGEDSIFVAFYQDGDVALMLEAQGSAAQTLLTVTVTEDHQLSAGNYFIILRVNGAQSPVTPQVVWS